MSGEQKYKDSKTNTAFVLRRFVPGLRRPCFEDLAKKQGLWKVLVLLLRYATDSGGSLQFGHVANTQISVIS